MKIPGYNIQKQIGQGGMASVYLATQKSLDRPVALKVLTNPKAHGFSERFLQEGRMIASLSHENIITIHDIAIADGILYISMEFVTGGTLKDRVREGLTPDAALKIIEKIGAALKVAHDNGIVHRDVKPTNILFRGDDTPVLTDFGIAKKPLTKSELTVTGNVVGTPSYLSPEQAKSATLDGRTDIYSLGIVLYEMLVGKKPYVGDSEIATIFKHVNDPLPILPKHLEKYQPLLERMVAKDPEQRFSDIDEMLQYVQHLRSNTLERSQTSIPHDETTDWETCNNSTLSRGARRSWLAGMDKLSLAAIGSVGLMLAIVIVLSTVKQDVQSAQGPSSANSDAIASEADNLTTNDVESHGAASKSTTGQLAVDSPQDSILTTRSDAGEEARKGQGEQMEYERDQAKRDRELEREQRKRYEELKREERKRQAEIAREERKRQKEMERKKDYTLEQSTNENSDKSSEPEYIEDKMYRAVKILRDLKDVVTQ